MSPWGKVFHFIKTSSYLPVYYYKFHLSCLSLSISHYTMMKYKIIILILSFTVILSWSFIHYTLNYVWSTVPDQVGISLDEKSVPHDLSWQWQEKLVPMYIMRIKKTPLHDDFFTNIQENMAMWGSKFTLFYLVCQVSSMGFISCTKLLCTESRAVENLVLYI